MTQFPLFLWVLISTTQSYILPTNEEFQNANNKLDWHDAETHCLEQYNSHLLSIHDANTYQQLRTKIIAINQDMNHFWIGLANIGNDHINYTWSDLSPFNFGNNINSGEFPWFDERPESPSTDRNVRLWGGSASLLWDDSNQNKKYFWICNSNNTRTDNIITINNNNNNNENATNKNTANFDTFWKVALIAVLTLSLCILLLRIRTIYKNYKRKSSFDVNSAGTDLSFIKSRTTTNIPALQFSSVDHRYDSESTDKCKRILISPFSNSESLLSIPQIPIPTQFNNMPIIKNKINLQIEHNVNTIDSILSIGDNMSMAATFDVNTYLNDTSSDSSNDITTDDSTTFSDKSTTDDETVVDANRTQSCFSTMVAFDIKSFKMKADEFKFDIYTENIHINTQNELENVDIGKDEFVISGETSLTSDSETSTIDIKIKLPNNNGNILELNDENNPLSPTEQEIKSNISQIMKNLKRMKNMSGSINDKESYLD